MSEPNYPTVTTTTQGQVQAVEPKPPTWFRNVIAEQKALTDQR